MNNLIKQIAFQLLFVVYYLQLDLDLNWCHSFTQHLYFEITFSFSLSCLAPEPYHCLPLPMEEEEEVNIPMQSSSAVGRDPPFSAFSSHLSLQFVVFIEAQMRATYQSENLEILEYYRIHMDHELFFEFPVFFITLNDTGDLQMIFYSC